MHTASPSNPLSARALTSVFVVSIFLICAGPAWSETVLIDLGDNFSDLSASNWNTMVYNVAVNDLVDDTGAPTGISFTPMFWTQDYQNGNNWIEDTDWVSKDAATDHFGSFFDSRIILGNLNGLYKLEVVIAHPQTNHLADITVNSAFADSNFQNIMGVNGDDFDPDVDGRDAQNWLIWNDIPVDGSLTLRVLKLAGSSAISVNAMRLTRVGDLLTSSVELTASADPLSVEAPGGSVDFTARIDNTGETSVEITSLTDSIAGNLDGQGDCSLPQTLSVSGFYECTYSAMVSGNAGDSEVHDVLTAGAGSSGAVNGNDSVTIDIIEPLVSSISVTADAGVMSVPEPGAAVDFTVRIDNTGNTSIDITSLSDDLSGSLDGAGDCALPQTIAVGNFYECTHSAMVSGNAGDSPTRTVTALGSGSAGAVDVSSGATVDVSDVMPTATLTKSTQCQGHMDEPGGPATFYVHLVNTSVESIELTDLFDGTHGDLDGQGDCSVPQTLAAGGDYKCSYTLNVTGVDGQRDISNLVATFQDDEVNIDTTNSRITVELHAAGDMLFSDCFESGTFAGWTVVPALP